MMDLDGFKYIENSLSANSIIVLFRIYFFMKKNI